MPKNNKESVKHDIQELAIGNYSSYPQDYNPEQQDINDNIQSLARGYWDVRDMKEVQRDERLGINLEDYISWSEEAFRELIGNHHNALN